MVPPPRLFIVAMSGPYSNYSRLEGCPDFGDLNRDVELCPPITPGASISVHLFIEHIHALFTVCDATKLTFHWYSYWYMDVTRPSHFSCKGLASETTEISWQKVIHCSKGMCLYVLPLYINYRRAGIMCGLHVFLTHIVDTDKGSFSYSYNVCKLRLTITNRD